LGGICGREEHEKECTDFNAADERMCIVRIKTKFHNLYLISVHAPKEE